MIMTVVLLFLYHFLEKKAIPQAWGHRKMGILPPAT